MGRLAGRSLVHLVDGRTLTDQDCYIHEVDPNLITSVERVVQGRHLTILKSPLVESFFIGTEAEGSLPCNMPGMSVVNAIALRWVGCFLKDTDPPIQCELTYEPNTTMGWVEFFYVKDKRKDGFSARLYKKPKARRLVQRRDDNGIYSIIEEPPVDRVIPIANGLSCTLKDLPFKGEMVIHNLNITLGIMKPSQMLIPGTLVS